MNNKELNCNKIKFSYECFEKYYFTKKFNKLEEFKTSKNP